MSEILKFVKNNIGYYSTYLLIGRLQCDLLTVNVNPAECKVVSIVVS